MAPKQRSKLTLNCEICGEPVELTRHRHLELVKAGELPRCRKNGCERLCGRKKPGAARMPELLDVIDVPLRQVQWPKSKKGNINGALAKLRVTTDQQWRWDAGPDSE